MRCEPHHSWVNRWPVAQFARRAIVYRIRHAPQGNAASPSGYPVLTHNRHKRERTMKRILLLICVAVLGASALTAQATGMPLYNAPYRAFQRSEIGGAVSFPSGGGTAFIGMYRMASGKLDLGFQAGVATCSGCNSAFLAGVEARERVLTHSADFPLDGA